MVDVTYKMRFSTEPRSRVFAKGYGLFAKGYGFLSFAKNIGKTITKNLSGKYSQKLFDHTKQFAANALKTASKRGNQKIAEATSSLMG